MSELTGASRVLLTPSCTAALELMALLLDFGPGDEVILPSFTFSSTANAFVLRGASLVFVDVDPATMNLDPEAVRAALTPRTKAVMAVHYGGVTTDMKALHQVLEGTAAVLLEDSAQGLCARRDGQHQGTFGALGCLSFHETKNVHCGEGGALLVNDLALAARAEILREKGTNRSQFFRGEVDKYSWCDLGSSYLLAEPLAAMLLPQLEDADAITQRRVAHYRAYRERLAPLADRGVLEFGVVPDGCEVNGHIVWAKVADLNVRTALLAHLRDADIRATFHFVPLHTSAAGRKFGRFVGEDHHTSSGADRIVRLPIFDALGEDDRDRVCDAVEAFFRTN